MPRNIEIKAHVHNPEELKQKVAALADKGPSEIRQDDTFFHCSDGRLKLRMFSVEKGELIYYQRADQSGPKESSYAIVQTESPSDLSALLMQALGTIGRVKKQRTLYLIGRTRVHLDRVEGLGDFVELEVVLSQGELAQAGIDEARALMTKLDIGESHLIETAYIDMLGAIKTDKRPRLKTGKCIT